MHHALRFCFIVALALCACAPVEPQSEIASGGPLLASMQAYTTGEEVTFVLQVLNTTDAAIDITFPSGQRFDFLVRDGGREVWRWSSERSFTQVVGVERLESGGTLRYEAVWRPGLTVRGEFDAVGIVTSSDHRLEQSTRINLP